jgi:hypothetical protein
MENSQRRKGGDGNGRRHVGVAVLDHAEAFIGVEECVGAGEDPMLSVARGIMRNRTSAQAERMIRSGIITAPRQPAPAWPVSPQSRL